MWASRNELTKDGQPLCMHIYNEKIEPNLFNKALLHGISWQCPVFLSTSVLYDMIRSFPYHYISVINRIISPSPKRSSHFAPNLPWISTSSLTLWISQLIYRITFSLFSSFSMAFLHVSSLAAFQSFVLATSYSKLAKERAIKRNQASHYS